MKSNLKNIAVTLLCCFAFACAPTSPNATDTTTLVSGVKTIALTKTASTQTTSVSMTCGCPFPVFIDSIGGDVNVITVKFADQITDTITPHSLQASFTPATAGTNSYSAWIALHSIHHAASGPILLRDTVFVTATAQ